MRSFLPEEADECSDASTFDDDSPSYTTASELCSSLTHFAAWSQGFNLKTVKESTCPFWPATLQLKIPKSLWPTSTNDEIQALYEELEKICEVDDNVGRHDPYRIVENASVICSTWRRFRRMTLLSRKANLRGPVNTLIEQVFDVNGTLIFEVGVPMLLPAVDREVQMQLNLGDDSAVHTDTVCNMPVNFVNVDGATKCALHNDVNLNAINRVRDISDDATSAVPVFFAEFTVNGDRTYQQKLYLDNLIALLHRRYVGIDAPVYSMSLDLQTLTFCKSSWVGNRPTLVMYNLLPSLTTFAQWVAFYIALVNIRTEIEGLPRPDIDVAAARDQTPWRSTAAVAY
ncbi:hypothetical protein EXIGLDRAFT_833664 [Exidia glandulosa HHB12029]|uniref:Uncharacterized protein n=1 Tax=Exidia glandulosa HHB12029 TaxID=1314781 RepID=A0A165KJG7_EXIGL|nr:hypothetical protein EXIGLDRAFT_833664 [Exidia glandulosa HHB12029]